MQVVQLLNAQSLSMELRVVKGGTRTATGMVWVVHFLHHFTFFISVLLSGLIEAFLKLLVTPVLVALFGCLVVANIDNIFRLVHNCLCNF